MVREEFLMWRWWLARAVGFKFQSTTKTSVRVVIPKWWVRMIPDAAKRFERVVGRKLAPHATVKAVGKRVLIAWKVER